MNVFVDYLSQGLRASRAPLSAGAVIVLAVWIQVSQRLSESWSNEPFVRHVLGLFETVSGIALGTALVLVVGIAGTVIIKASSILVEPGMRWVVSRWHRRTAVRSHMRRGRFDPFENNNSTEDAAYLIVQRERKYFSNSWQWLVDWFPRKSDYIAYEEAHIWDSPRWGEEILNWVVNEIYVALRPQWPRESLLSLRRRISDDTDLRRKVMDLEREIEANPAACFTNGEHQVLMSRLNAQVSENDYRVAVTPPLALLSISIGIAWWSWVLFLLPLLLVVYGASLAKREEISRLALGWLLDGKGTCHSLRQVRLWAREMAVSIKNDGTYFNPGLADDS